jgi:hypothetical protein
MPDIGWTRYIEGLQRAADEECSAVRARYGVGDPEKLGLDCENMPCHAECPFEGRRAVEEASAEHMAAQAS